MSRPVWITKGGNLGIFPELEFYSLPLEVYNPTNTPVTFSFLSGELPPGLQVISTGSLQGVPVVTDATTVDELRTYKFTIRASCQTPVVVVDRTFEFSVSNIRPPQIIPETQLLGEFFDGTLFEYQLYAREWNPKARLIWTLKEGALPPGIELTEDGLLHGYISQYIPPEIPAIGYDAQATQSQVLFSPTDTVTVPDIQTFGGNGQPYSLVTTEPFGDPQKYEYYKYDVSNTVSSNNNYTFTVQVYDGANYDVQTYTLKVIAKGTWTTDNNTNTVDDNIITTDADQKYVPIITTSVSSLPVVRQNSNFSFKFSAVDFYNTSPLTWSTNITSLLPSMSLDANTGWLTGHIDTQIDYKKTYTFSVNVANVYTNANGYTTSYTSNNVNYKLTVLGDVNNRIIWDTPALVGNIINGAVSELTISSHSTLYVDDVTTPGKNVTYEIVHGTDDNGDPSIGSGYATPTRVQLPQGLQLLPSGRIVGRTSFRHFQLDSAATTIDGGKTTFDNIYTFTVKATTLDNTVSDTKTFQVRVNNLYSRPYENLYIQAFPTMAERRLFRDILDDSSLFPAASIYRPDDPYFGKAKEIKFLASPGLEPSTLSEYVAAMQKNFSNKRLSLSEIKTAIATDPNNNYAVKYEVVYVDIVDPFNPTNADVKLETNLYYAVNHINNPYIDASGNQYHIIDPNTFDNMESRISSGIGYSAQGVIPDWMTSVQEDKTVLGFKRSVVLAYTKPGQSKKIAYRLNDRSIDFNAIVFEADRYVLDNSLSTNFNIATTTFVKGRETTFDYLVLQDSTSYDIVNYAATQPFASINNQLASTIAKNGGIDGVKSYLPGDRLIFAKQEDFNSVYPYDGWIYTRDLFMGNYSDILDDVDQSFYDVSPYDDSYIIPGWTEKYIDNKNANLVAGISIADEFIYVPYIVGQSYIGRLVRANGAIDYNCLAVSQVADNSTGTLAWKIGISLPTINELPAGTTIYFDPYVVVTDVTDNYITATSWPDDSTKSNMINKVVNGMGIPAGTRIYNIDGDVMLVENPNNDPITIEPGDYLGYYADNQRAGIWEIEVDGANVVKLKFIKELTQGAVVKVLDGRSHGASYMQYSHSVATGDSVPKFVKVPNRITYNGADGGRTSFDSGGTKFFDHRDTPAQPLPVLPESIVWESNMPYDINSIVSYQGQYYRALRPIVPAFYFSRTTDVNGITTVQWERIEDIRSNGDKYIKFPKLGVFN